MHGEKCLQDEGVECGRGAEGVGKRMSRPEIEQGRRVAELDIEVHKDGFQRRLHRERDRQVDSDRALADSSLGRGDYDDAAVLGRVRGVATEMRFEPVTHVAARTMEEDFEFVVRDRRRHDLAHAHSHRPEREFGVDFGDEHEFDIGKVGVEILRNRQCLANRNVIAENDDFRHVLEIKAEHTSYSVESRDVVDVFSTHNHNFVVGNGLDLLGQFGIRGKHQDVRHGFNTPPAIVPALPVSVSAFCLVAQTLPNSTALTIRRALRPETATVIIWAPPT